MASSRKCSKCQAELEEDWFQPLCSRCLNADTVLAGEPLPRAIGGDFSPPHPDALRLLFPQLEIVSLLGSGGMGAVYRARQRGLDRQVALKILPPNFAGDAGFAERFAREARTLARLNHLNIVDVYDLGQTGRLYYFLMEFVDGVTLREVLHEHRLTPPEVLSIVTQICEALEYAHGEGIVHRDIKPENIMLDRKGHVKITDFGLAKLLGKDTRQVRLTQPEHVLGTMHYMAPEQFENPLSVDHRADLYSLGVVFYEMLTGELPLGRFEVPSQKASVDARLDELVLRALEKNPARRWQNASEMRIQLDSLSGTPTRISPEVTWRLSYEYRSRLTVFGWPLVHVATGVDPATGRKRKARGIIAMGSAPLGVIAFGDYALGIIACGIFGVGVLSLSVFSVGLIALGTVAVGCTLSMGGIAVAPIAMGGAAIGYLAQGALAWGTHALSPGLNDSFAQKFFSRQTALTGWVFRLCLFSTPFFLVLGMLPSVMAKRAERRRLRRFSQMRKPCQPSPTVQANSS